MNPLFENAIDSLVLGVNFYVEKPIANPYKHSILNIFHSIELFLKEGLYRVHPILISKNIDKPIHDDTLTVGLKEILARFRNLKINLDKKDQDIIVELQKRRNTIEHHHYSEDESDFYIIGKSLRFIYFFLPNHLGEKLESFLDEKLYSKVREIILKYEERLREAEEEVSKLTTPRTKDDLCDPVDSALCPECCNYTVVIGTERGNYCFFCRKEQELSQCEWCSGYFPKEEINEFDMCDDCLTERLEKL